MARAAEEAGEATVAELQKQIRAIQGDVAALTGTLREYGKEQFDHAAGTVRSAVDNAGKSVRMGAEEARARGEHFAEEVETTITRNPMTSVLVALGVGFIAGMMSRH